MMHLISFLCNKNGIILCITINGMLVCVKTTPFILNIYGLTFLNIFYRHIQKSIGNESLKKCNSNVLGI